MLSQDGTACYSSPVPYQRELCRFQIGRIEVEGFSAMFGRPRVVEIPDGLGLKEGVVPIGIQNHRVIRRVDVVLLEPCLEVCSTIRFPFGIAKDIDVIYGFRESLGHRND